MLLARYDIGALQRGTFKNSTLGVFINSEWSAFGYSGSRHVRNSELGTMFGGHSEPGAFGPGAQSGRKNEPTCRTVCRCQSVTLVNPANMAETIKLSFAFRTRVGPMNHVLLSLNEVQMPTWEGTILRAKMANQYRNTLLSSVQTR